MTAEHAVSDGMECATPKSAGINWQKIHDAIKHLSGGLIRKREEENISRVDSVLEQISDPVSKGAGFTAARTGNNEERTGCSGHRGELFLI